MLMWRVTRQCSLDLNFSCAAVTVKIRALTIVWPWKDTFNYFLSLSSQGNECDLFSLSLSPLWAAHCRDTRHNFLAFFLFPPALAHLFLSLLMSTELSSILLSACLSFPLSYTHTCLDLNAHASEMKNIKTAWHNNRWMWYCFFRDTCYSPWCEEER